MRDKDQFHQEIKLWVGPEDKNGGSSGNVRSSEDIFALGVTWANRAALKLILCLYQNIYTYTKY